MRSVVQRVVNHVVFVAVGAVGAVGWVGVARAQSAPAADSPPADVLSGPKVAETTSERTLVQRDFSGKVRRLEVPPEEAAIELLTLDEGARARVQRVLDERAAIMDRILADNLDLLVRFQSARERRDRLKLLGEFRVAMEPLEARGTLRAELRAELPKSEAGRFDQLVDGYWETVTKEAVAEAKASDPKAKAGEVIVRERLQALGNEVRRAYDRRITQSVKQLDEFLAKLNLTPEQDAEVRGHVTRFVERTKGNANPAQRRELFGKILAGLNADQKRLLIAEVVGATARPGRPSATPTDDPAMKPEGDGR